MQNVVRKYYFVSELHMGGDGQLQQCDYTAEFIAFLKQLEKEGPDTELLIVGDTFGFWELTLVRGGRDDPRAAQTAARYARRGDLGRKEHEQLGVVTSK